MVILGGPMVNTFILSAEDRARGFKSNRGKPHRHLNILSPSNKSC